MDGPYKNIYNMASFAARRAFACCTILAAARPPAPPSSRQVAPCDDDATFARAWSKCCRPVCWP